MACGTLDACACNNIRLYPLITGIFGRYAVQNSGWAAGCNQANGLHRQILVEFRRENRKDDEIMGRTSQ